ncbi:ABC transporter permease subunit [bacterium]|nr:ABC transporter permease subunit [bacterium]
MVKAVNFFVVTVLFLLVTYVVDQTIREPIAVGSSSSWTTILTPLNPFLVLESLLHPTGYATPESSRLGWPIGWLVTHPVAGWVWITIIGSLTIITWSSLQVRKLGDRGVKESLWKRLTKYGEQHREPHAVSGNPIAWRERVTRHRNIGSLLGSWGFVSVFGLTFIILATLFFTRTLSGDVFRDITQYLVVAELLIVTFFAISLSASSIAKEREDGSLDLLLTTSITPKMYLGGKMRGLVMHLLPMVLVPCVTMMTMGILVLLNPEHAVVTDVWSQTSQMPTATPLALYLPALVFPVSFIPYISFCMVLGLLWSMRSKGTIGAIITTLILVFILTAGLGVCLVPVQGIPILGTGLSSLSPFSLMFAILSPANSLPSVLEDGARATNIRLGVTTVIAGVVWTGLCFGLLRSMSASFVTTVRRLAGIS